jgi:DNA-binding CsgD family transcriptional regulator
MPVCETHERPSIASMSTFPEYDSRMIRLSPREREVLELATRGLTNGQIAERLFVTVHAVKFHLTSVYRKLGVPNRTAAAFVYEQAKHREAQGG